MGQNKKDRGSLMKKLREIGIILFSVWGFWGMIYPDLCFTEDVCEIVADERGKDGETDIFTGICDAGPGQIRMKSRIWEKLKPESNGVNHGANDEFSDE